MSTKTDQDRLAGTWSLVPVHSSVDFAVEFTVINFRAGFGDIDAKLENGKLSGSAKAASIVVKDDNFLGHLLTDEFLDAEANPEITFESDSITVDGDKVTLDGNLTIAGKTHPFHATGTIGGPLEGSQGPQLGLTLEGTFDRSAYGIVFNGELPDGSKALSNDVTLRAELEFSQG